jgi:hypothetical protein
MQEAFQPNGDSYMHEQKHFNQMATHLKNPLLHFFMACTFESPYFVPILPLPNADHQPSLAGLSQQCYASKYIFLYLLSTD